MTNNDEYMDATNDVSDVIWEPVSSRSSMVRFEDIENTYVAYVRSEKMVHKGIVFKNGDLCFEHMGLNLTKLKSKLIKGILDLEFDI